MDGIFLGLAGLLLEISLGICPREIPWSSPASVWKTHTSFFTWINPIFLKKGQSDDQIEGCILIVALHLMEKIHSGNINRWISYFCCGRNFTLITCWGEILPVKNTTYFSCIFIYKIIYKLVTLLYIVKDFFSFKYAIVFPLSLEYWIKKQRHSFH